jgi:hypothetical protein
MEINVKADIKQAMKRLNRIQRRQVPYATKVALDATAFDARKATQAQLPRKLKAPTPWTIRGVRVEKAKKTKPVAAVFFNPDRAKYMKYQISGGTRTNSSGPVLVPKTIRLNKYGNIPRGKIRKLLQQPDTFIGTIRGVSGVWQRGHISKSGKFSRRTKSRGSNVRLLARFEDQAVYKSRFPFRKIVGGVVRSKFSRNFNQALRRALKTAK